MVGSNSDKVIRVPNSSKTLSASVPLPEKQPQVLPTTPPSLPNEESPAKSRKTTVMKRAINAYHCPCLVSGRHINTLKKEEAEAIPLSAIPSIRLDSLFIPEEEVESLSPHNR